MVITPWYLLSLRGLVNKDGPSFYGFANIVEHRTTVREVAGSTPGRTNTQGLKITEEKVLPL